MTAREVLDGIKARLAAARVCTYCIEPEGQKHKGFCLTRMEGAREEYVADAAAPTDVARLVAAMEAVLSIHKVHGGYLYAGDICWECSDDESETPYPCPTVAVVEAALNWSGFIANARRHEFGGDLDYRFHEDDIAKEDPQ